MLKFAKWHFSSIITLRLMAEFCRISPLKTMRGNYFRQLWGQLDSHNWFSPTGTKASNVFVHLYFDFHGVFLCTLLKVPKLYPSLDVYLHPRLLKCGLLSKGGTLKKSFFKKILEWCILCCRKIRRTFFLNTIIFDQCSWFIRCISPKYYAAQYL